MTLCDQESSFCYSTLILFGFPLFSLVIAVALALRVYSERLNRFGGLRITILEIFIGKNAGSETVYLLNWLDILRIVLAVVIGVIAFVSEQRLGFDGAISVINAFIFDGLLPQLLFLRLLVLEIQTGSSESVATGFFTLLNFLAQSGKLIWLLEAENGPIKTDLLLILGLQVTVKAVLYVVYSCVNRDIRLLRKKLHKALDLEYEALIDANDSVDEYDEEATDVENVARTPEQYAGLLSKLSFAWLNSLMKKGFDRPLEETDFYKLMRSDDASDLSRRFVTAFNHLAKQQSTPKAASLDETEIQKVNYWLIVKAWHRAGVLSLFYEAALFKVVYDTLNFVPPQMMKAIISFMMASEEDESEANGLIFVGILFIAAAIQTIVLHQYFHRVYRTGLRVRSALLTAIYQKSLRLSPEAKTKQTVGQIVNLMSTDTNRLQNLFSYLHISWSALYVILLSTLFLWNQLKYAVFVAQAVVILFILPLTNFVSKRIKAAQKQVMKVKDERIKLTTETISAIKTLKLYGWERAFRGKVSEVRTRELSKLVSYLRWRVFASFLWPITPIIMTLCTFATYTLIEGKSFDAATAFTALSLLNILRFPLAVFPNVINSVVEATVSLKRIAAFLMSEEIDQMLIKDTAEAEDVALQAKGDFFWDDNCAVVALKDIDFSVKKGEMVIVTGKVGSGKSALLKLFVNDLTTTEGTVSVNGSVAYSNQVPWIQNATVKDNILFGKPYEAEWYQNVVFSCALLSDFDQLPFGDATEIGERGINLSGGQKARIALARAVYSRNEVLLLESCFEAVDEHVGDHIWTHCFMKLLYKKRTVVCVTHALKRLKKVDSLVVMTEGRMSGRGTYQQLLQSDNCDFKDLLEAHAKQQAATAEEEVPNGKSSRKASKEEEELETATATGKKKHKMKADENDLTGKEERGVGQVSLEVYRTYINAGGGLSSVFLMMIAFICKVGLDFLTNRWLAYWSSHSKPTLHDMLLFKTQNLHTDLALAAIDLQLEESEEISVRYFLGIYALLSFLSMGFIIGSLVIVLYAGYKASISMHSQLIYKICRAPMAFFDTTPTGRILNRFSKDIYTVDEVLPYTLLSLLSTSFGVLGTFFSIAYVAPGFLIVVPFLAVFYRSIQKYYIASSRELKRWDSVLRSPIYSYFTETLEGTSTIRAFRRQGDFTKTNFNQVERNQRAYYLSVAANRWLAVRLEFVGTFLRVFAALFVVIGRGKLDPGLAGLALTYAFGITQTLNWTVRMFSDMETNIVSVERLTEYIAVASEAEEERKCVIKDDWPHEGAIVFTDVRARYREGLPLVLRGLTLTIQPGEKVGIVGRTGAGKSSLFLVLMRLVEPCGGKIEIDGVDLQNLGLLQLRQRIAIIPQDPVMFSGSVRDNLDPTHAHSDADIVAALKLCKIHPHLVSMVSQEEESSKLEVQFPELFVEITESGNNLSFGQRQLLCIARAVLRNCKVLLLDEATSGIDLSTDSSIQETIRTEFKSKTVLTVAHRIETILGGDKVLVMDQGLVKEFDAPAKLLDNPKSVFSELVQRMKTEQDS